MCDPVSIAMSVGSSLLSSMAQSNETARQTAIANRQRDAEIVAANQRVQAEFSETNRQIAEAQQEGFEQESDVIRQANEQLGALRAAETSLTDVSLGNLFFESFYSNSADLQTIEDNVNKQKDAGEAQKVASSQGYLNTVRLASNQAENTIQRARSNASSSQLNILSSVASSVGDEYKHQQKLKRIRKEV